MHTAGKFWIHVVQMTSELLRWLNVHYFVSGQPLVMRVRYPSSCIALNSMCKGFSFSFCLILLCMTSSCLCWVVTHKLMRLQCSECVHSSISSHNTLPQWQWPLRDGPSWVKIWLTWKPAPKPSFFFCHHIWQQNINCCVTYHGNLIYSLKMKTWFFMLSKFFHNLLPYLKRLLFTIVASSLIRFFVTAEQQVKHKALSVSHNDAISTIETNLSWMILKRLQSQITWMES